MYKVLCVLAIVFAAFTLNQNSRPARASTNSLTFPLTVAQLSLTGQTQPVPLTTLFTPSSTGLYRISGYLVMTEPARSKQEQDWLVTLKFTDDTSGEEAGLFVVGDQAIPPFAYGYDPGLNSNAGAFTFRAVSGNPVYYRVGYDQTLVAGGTYDLYLVVEELT
jgi:hypothetical protein